MTNDVQRAVSAHTHVDRPLLGVLGLIAVLLGLVLLVVGFLGGIDAALNGSGTGAGVFTTLFFLGAALVLAGIVFAIVQLVRGRDRLLAVFTLLIALIPVLGVVILRLAALV